MSVDREMDDGAARVKWRPRFGKCNVGHALRPDELDDGKDDKQLMDSGCPRTGWLVFFGGGSCLALDGNGLLND